MFCMEDETVVWRGLSNTDMLRTHFKAKKSNTSTMFGFLVGLYRILKCHLKEHKLFLSLG